jgi:hypothetical protein
MTKVSATTQLDLMSKSYFESLSRRTSLAGGTTLILQHHPLRTLALSLKTALQPIEVRKTQDTRLVRPAIWQHGKKVDKRLD